MTDKKIIQKEKRKVMTKGELTTEGIFFTPDTDICEDDNKVVIIADMPGVKKESLDITLENNELKITGSVKYDYPGKSLLNQYQIGNYFRKFSLSNVFDWEKINANLIDGVLKIELPKSDSIKPKKIAIKTQ